MREQYWKYSLIAFIIVLGIILFKEFTPFMGGVLGAFTIYVLLRKQMFYLTEKKKMRPSIAASLLLGETILCFLVPLYFAVWLLVSRIQNINLDANTIADTAQHIADLVQQKTGYNIFDRDNLLNVAAYLPKVGQSLVGSISGFVVNLIALIFILYFMLIGARKMENYFYAIMPFNPNNKDKVLHEVNMLVRSNAIGIPLLAIIQGAIAMIGYIIFKTPEPLIFGFLTCFATIIPIVGTALVWFPLAAYLALTGDWINAIGLTAYALIIISNIDNLIRLFLQKKMADTHPLITIFGVIIGLSLFGFMGVIFGPLLLAFFLLCVNMFKEEYLDPKNDKS